MRDGAAASCGTLARKVQHATPVKAVDVGGPKVHSSMRGPVLGLIVLCAVLQSEALRTTPGLFRYSPLAPPRTAARARGAWVRSAAAPNFGGVMGKRVRFRQVAERFRQWRADVRKIMMSEEEAPTRDDDPAATDGRGTLGAPFGPADTWPSPSIRMFATESRARLREVWWLLFLWIRGKIQTIATALVSRSQQTLRAFRATISKRSNRL